MIWNSWADFVAMGGYGLYVWGSFGVTALVIVGEIWAVAARRRALSRREHDADSADLGETS
ncbi:MAG: heme exporter protein CcmD [Pseudomonadota bacterium]|jgi:heme exporter protein D|nr:heme exporter protein CcmD [Pseudomonadota bacterium]